MAKKNGKRPKKTSEIAEKITKKALKTSKIGPINVKKDVSRPKKKPENCQKKSENSQKKTGNPPKIAQQSFKKSTGPQENYNQIWPQVALCCLPGSSWLTCYHLLSVVRRPEKEHKNNWQNRGTLQNLLEFEFFTRNFLKSCFWLGNQLASVIQVL